MPYENTCLAKILLLKMAENKSVYLKCLLYSFVAISLSLSNNNEFT